MLPLTLRAVRCWLPLLVLSLAYILPAAEVRGEVPPKGEVRQYTFADSKIFPGTTRQVWVYVPAQYRGDKPACLYVNQDGVQFKAPEVFDTLIAAGEMPVTIGVFVTPGKVVAADGDAALDRFNRSFEYDGLGDNYARFLVDELLPFVEQQTTSDGRAVRLSKDANDRGIGGSSSGAVCAFTAAWERPDAFRRVFSSIGTYVGLRGADRYHTLVRKYEPKPLRVFLQDGSNDLNIYAGDWWMANQTMQRALSYSGYEVKHVWGEGGHNGQQATELFTEAMRWLWEDWPQPVQAGTSQNQMLTEILVPDAQWELVADGYRFTEGPAANAQGEVFYNAVLADGSGGRTFRVGADGKPIAFLPDNQRGDGQEFGPDGRLYSYAAGPKALLAHDADGKTTTIAADFAGGNDLVVAHNGNIYATRNDGNSGSVWLVKPDGKPQSVASGLKFANGIMLSPDGSLLYVSDTRSHWVYSYVIKPNGTLAFGQKYYWLHAPDTADDAGADGLCVDRDGRLYVATRLGVQVCDQAGRVNCILPLPNGKVSNLCFGGADFRTLYATCGDRVYRREMKVQGANAWAAPVKPAAPRL